MITRTRMTSMSNAQLRHENIKWHTIFKILIRLLLEMFEISSESQKARFSPEKLEWNKIQQMTSDFQVLDYNQESLNDIKVSKAQLSSEKSRMA